MGGKRTEFKCPEMWAPVVGIGCLLHPQCDGTWHEGQEFCKRISPEHSHLVEPRSIDDLNRIKHYGFLQPGNKTDQRSPDRLERRCSGPWVGGRQKDNPREPVSSRSLGKHKY